jgi:aarF domain-containing kinase
VYQKFNRNPIAAASLAEVYEAETKDGQRVAVKVQYSDLRERYETDIATVDSNKQINKFYFLLIR